MGVSEQVLEALPVKEFRECVHKFSIRGAAR
jgi:hypothetical protein